MQTKHTKQQKALNRLLVELDHERTQRERLQNQEFRLIAPSHREERLSQEVYTLRVKLGMAKESPTIF